jgi:4-hydroxybenzoate polyprenyltransferase
MHFLRLIRPLNLVIIALSMYSVRLFIYIYAQQFDLNTATAGTWYDLDFFLLVLSTTLIAAGGNIINDYFDVRSDRINKPHKLIISKYIKPRWAIISHWILNTVAITIAIYLSWHNNSLMYVTVHLISICCLWFYSVYFKRLPLIGNFMIASLTALVPLLCGFHFYIQHGFPMAYSGKINSTFNYWIYHLVQNGNFIFILAFFAFSNNFSREIIKDIEDIKGDIALNAKTFPIQYGEKKSKLIASIIWLCSLFFFILICYQNLHYFEGSIMYNTLVFLPIILSFTVNFASLIVLFKAQTRLQYKLSDRLIKGSMLLGLSLPFYWYIFL